MSSTKITTNADALARAADAVLARSQAPSKNAILNALAAAIAGPGHDWGFLKNTPSGSFTQAGLASDPLPATPASSVWIVLYDERDDWARAPMVFASKDAALAFVAGDKSWWNHGDHPADKVLQALEQSGEYIFSPEDGEDDEKCAPYSISIAETPIQPAAPQRPGSTPALPTATAWLIERTDEVDGDTGKGVILEDGFPVARLHDAADYAERQGVTLEALNRLLPDNVYHSQDCRLIASFRPEVWVRDTAMEVDPLGESEWEVRPDELDTTAQDLDYLRDADAAPAWVKDWTGPFEVYLQIEYPDQK